MVKRRNTWTNPSIEAYWNAYHAPRLDKEALSRGVPVEVYLRLFGHNRLALSGVVLPMFEIGSISIALALFDEDMKPTGKIYMGKMSNGIWNPNPTPPMTVEVGHKERRAYQGVFAPYSGKVAIDRFFEEEAEGPKTPSPIVGVQSPHFRAN